MLTLSLAGCAATTPQPFSPSTASPAVATRAVITDVSTEVLTDAVRVLVQSTKPLQYTAFKLQAPPRLVVDIADASLGELPQPIPVVGEIVQRIEPLVFSEERIVRLTLHLLRMVSHTIEVQGQQLRILLKDAVGQETAEPRPADAVTPSTPSPMIVTPQPVKPAAEPSAAAGTIVTGVAFVSLPDKSVLAIQTSGTPPNVRVKRSQDPLRLLLEIEDARLAPDQERSESVSDPGGVVTALQALQAVQKADHKVNVEVVTHLRVLAPFEVQQDENLIRLVMTKPPATIETQMPAAPEPSMTTTSPTAAVPPPASAAEEALPAIPSIPPSVAQLPLAGNTKTIVPRQEPEAAPSVAEPSGDQPASIGATTISEPELPRTYIGEKISLDFQNADVNDILRLIAEVSGLNIIAGGDVQGTVTTRMVDVPWDQALDVILKINGLDQERDGNIIRIAPIGRFISERQERLRARQTKAQAEPTTTQVVSVNYAAATEISTNLERLLSERGSIFVDERTNTLIITDTRGSLDDILALLETLDRQTPQVMIEARIVEATRDFSRELGVKFGFLYNKVTDKTFPSRVGVGGTASDGNFVVDLPAAVGPGSGGAIGFMLAGANNLLDLELSAAESSGDSKIISNPKIATLDNTEAVIQSGTRIPFETVSAEGTQTEFVDATITLKVTPHVTPDGFISMQINVAKNAPDQSVTSAQGQPSIDTREANTTMLVRDGDTVVIGGLYQRALASSRDGVPWLQDVPVLGWLFHKKNQSDQHEELLIFITPRIIRQPGRQSSPRVSASY